MQRRRGPSLVVYLFGLLRERWRHSPRLRNCLSWGAVHRNQFSMPKGVCSATKERNSNISLSVSPSSYSCCLVWVFRKHVLICGADACLCSMSRLFVRIGNKYISGFTRRGPQSPCEASLSRQQRHVAVDVFCGRCVAKGRSEQQGRRTLHPH